MKEKKEGRREEEEEKEEEKRKNNINNNFLPAACTQDSGRDKNSKTDPQGTAITNRIPKQKF